MKEEEAITVVEEGGLVVYTELGTDIIKMIRTEAEIICPSCGTTMALNGRCKTCVECGWSSCDI